MTLPRVRPRRALSAGIVLGLMIGLLPAAPASATVFSGALTLNGSTQYVTMGASTSLRSSQFTVELWFRKTGAGVGASTGSNGLTSAIPLITKGTADGESAAQDINYLLGIDSATNVLVADFEEAQTGANPSSNHPITGTTIITNNVWHHAAATYDGTTWSLYLDGALDKTEAEGQPANTAVTSATAIGTGLKNDGNRVGFFAGQVDEVRIWSSARSQAQIQGSMSSELGATSGMLGMWHLNEGTGTTANDSSGAVTLNNGTLVNTPTWATSGAPLSAVTTGALTLNGTTQYVTMGASPNLRSAQFTVELWFRRTGTGGVGIDTGAGGIPSAIPLITKGRAEGETAAADVNYFLGIDTTSNKLVADFEEAQSGAVPSSNHPITGATVISNNVWHHAAATYDGTTWRLYLDGAADGSLTVGQPPNTAVTSGTAIGSALRTDNSAAGFFQGQIDEARIWASARSQAQIQSSMSMEIGPTNGLLGLWHMNATSGTNVADGCGNATLNNGTTVASPVWSTGTPLSIVNGLQLNGSTQYVTMGASPALRSSQFTVELWFRRTGAGVGTGTGNGGITSAIPLITKGRAEAETADADMNYFMGIDATSGKLVADFEEAQSGASPSTNHPITGTAVITSNVWHHAAATYDGTTWRLYLDGAVDGSLTVGQPPNSAVLSATAIGTAFTSSVASPPSTAAGFFQGQIDEARIWNVARTQGQIQSTMNAEVGTTPGLIGSWHLNEGTGTAVADSSGSGINGTTVATPIWTYGMLLGAPPANQSPVVDSVAIDQASPHTNDTLSATVTSHDPDSDTVTYSYQWTKNGSDIAGATSATLNLATAGNGDRTDQIRLRVVGSDGTLSSAPLTSLPVTVLNTAPTATVALDDHSPGTNATLTATATKADIDGDPVGLTYVWKVDGTTRQTTTTTSLTDTFDLSQPGNGNNGQSVSVTVTPNDGTDDGAPVADTATIGNAAPVVDSVAIDQASPATDDMLTATVTSHDADGDTLTTSYQWTLNGADIAGATDPTLDLSTAGNGDRGDLIRVRVTVSDGATTSAPVTALPVTILNTAPSATVALDDHSPGTNATLTATATTADVDGDPVGLTYVWTVNGIVRQTTVTTALTDTFDLSVATHGDNGDDVAVEVTPNDGTIDGAPADDSATVGNATPVVDSVAIDQASPRTNDTLTATVNAHDPDGDGLTYAYQWAKNGSDILGATGATLDLATVGNGDRADLIRVRVTASDGTATSDALTSSPVTVLNTAPTATEALDDPSPGTNATLTATATKADVDGDAVGLTYVWKVDGTTRQTTTTTSLTDTFDLSQPGNGNNGQSVSVTVTPNDGTDDGAPVADTATVGNAAPVVDSVAIDQAAPRTNDSLTVTVTAHDPDGDGLTYAYQWTKNGSDIAGATGAALDLSIAGNGSQGDQIRVRVTASDGALQSGPLTSAPVTVENSAPIASVALDDHTPGSSQSLLATATTSDADLDAVGLTYVWTVNGVTKRTQTTTALTDTFDLSVAGNGDGGDTIVVSVTPNDGTVNGTTATDTAIVSAGAGTPVFSDDFTSGDFGAWTKATRMTIDGTTGSPAAPSARAQVTNQSAFAYFDPTPTLTQACFSANVNLATTGVVVDLLRLRTASNGPLTKLFVHSSGNLRIRSEFAAQNFDTGTVLGAGWHNVEMCGTVGTGTTWDVYLDGAHVASWNTNTGTDPIGRVQIGDNTVNTFTVNFDHVILDHAPGEVVAPDTTPPTMPGQPIGASPSAGAIQIAWSASTDESPPITYRVYRDGNPTSVGMTTALTFIDTGLAPGSSHTYTVDAVDAVNPGLPSAMSPPSASIIVVSDTPPIFAEDFSASFLNWTSVTRMSLDNSNGSPTPASARAQVAGQSAFAYHDLGGTFSELCVSMDVNIASGTGVDLFRLKTAANGPIVRVVIVNPTQKLQIRSDVGSTVVNSGVSIGAGWHELELCGTVGSATSWDLYRDGVRIVTSWVANTGTTPIGRIQIGDTSASTFTANFDHVIVDQVPGEASAPDSSAPTTPGQPTGSSASAGAIQIGWSASSDDSPPITYRVYRDGGSTPIGSTTATTFLDSGLVPGSSHTYTVDAVDAVNPTLPSPMSPPSDPIVVFEGTPAIFEDDFSSGDFSNWTTVTGLTIDGTIGGTGAPSARAQATGVAANAVRVLEQTYSQACLSVNINVASAGTAIDLLKLRTILNGQLMRVTLTAAGKLSIRSEVSSAVLNSGVSLGSGWHNIELCGTVGTATTWDLYRDGARIVNAWGANTGTTPIGLVQIGDTSASTFTGNFDDVRLDGQAG